MEERSSEALLYELMSNKFKYNLEPHQQAKYFYVGKPTKENIPSLYLICARFSFDLIQDSDAVIVHIVSVAGAVLNSPFVIVFDFSFAELSDTYMVAAKKLFSRVLEVMSPKFTQNLQEVFMIQPDRDVVEATKEIMNPLMQNEKNSEKVAIFFDWSHMNEVFDPLNIYLPLVSRKFIPRSFSLTSKSLGSCIVKVTFGSLMIFSEGSTNKLLRELPLSHLLTVDSEGERNVTLKFRQMSDEEKKQIAPGYFYNCGSSLEKITFTCATEMTRDNFVELIIETFIRSKPHHIQAYEAVKESAKTGEQYKMTLRLTTDSILCIVDMKIKKEIPYSLLVAASVSNRSERHILIKYFQQGEDKYLKVELSLGAQELEAAVDEAMAKYGRNIKADTFPRTNIDDILDGFFSLFSINKELFKNKSVDLTSVINERYLLGEDKSDLTFEDFVEFLQAQSSDESNPNKGSIEKLIQDMDRLHHTFNKIDLDGNNKISPEDFIQSYLILCRQVKGSEIKQKSSPHNITIDTMNQPSNKKSLFGKFKNMIGL